MKITRQKKFLALAIWLVPMLLVACISQPGQTPVSPTDTSLAETAAPYPPPRTPVVVLNGPAYPAPVASATPTNAPAGPTPTPDLFTYQRDAWQSISPDGRSSARIVVALPQLPDGTLVGDKYHVHVSVVDFQDNSQQVVLDEWRNWGLGYTTPQVLGWTADSGDFYLVESGVPDGCGPVFFQTVRRVEAGSGQATLVVEHPGSALALSPAGDRLAAVGQAQLLVYDLERGEQTTLPFEVPDTEFWPGVIAWAPDGQQLLFSVKHNPCGASEEQSGSLYLVDLSGGGYSQVLDADPRQLEVLSWPLDDLAQLGDPNRKDYWLQVSSGQISEEPPAEIAAARQALYAFFAALQSGDYEQAAGLYGGTYDGLEDNNPSIDPNDRGALLENGCLLNGYQCLLVYRAILIDQPAAGEYRFRVSFDQDGQAFVLGPCCGADISEMPPLSEFTYTVKQDEAGDFRVMELPVYVP